MDGKENTFEASPLSLSSPFPSSVNERANGAHRSVRCDGAGPATLITTALHLRSLCSAERKSSGREEGEEGRLAHSVAPTDIIHLVVAKKCFVEI